MRCVRFIVSTTLLTCLTVPAAIARQADLAPAPFVREREATYAPVRVVSASTTPGPGWLRDLTVEVENRSQEPIHLIRYGVVFTQLGWPRSRLEEEMTFGTFRYGRELDPAAPSVAPGARVVLRFSPESLARLEAAVAELKLQQSSPIELVPEFVGFRSSSWGTAASDRPASVANPRNAGPYAYAIALSPDGRTLAVAKRLGAIELVAPDGASRTVAYRDHTYGVSSLTFSPDGRQLLVCSATRATRLDVATGRTLGDVALLRADAVVASADASYVATVKNRFEINPLAGAVGIAVTLSPYGSLLGAHDEIDVAGYEQPSGRRKLLVETSGIAYAVAVSGDGRYVAVLSGSGAIRVVERRRQRIVRELAPARRSFGLALDATGERIAFVDAERRAVIVAATATGSEVARFDAGDVMVALAFAPDGSALAACGLDKTMVWGLPGGRLLLEDRDWYEPAPARMAFSADGRTFVVVSHRAPKRFVLDTVRESRESDSRDSRMSYPPTPPLSSGWTTHSPRASTPAQIRSTSPTAASYGLPSSSSTAVSGERVNSTTTPG